MKVSELLFPNHQILAAGDLIAVFRVRKTGEWYAERVVAIAVPLRDEFDDEEIQTASDAYYVAGWCWITTSDISYDIAQVCTSVDVQRIATYEVIAHPGNIDGLAPRVDVDLVRKAIEADKMKR